jgi:hypothetical protein
MFRSLADHYQGAVMLESRVVGCVHCDEDVA